VARDHVICHITTKSEDLQVTTSSSCTSLHHHLPKTTIYKRRHATYKADGKGYQSVSAEGGADMIPLLTRELKGQLEGGGDPIVWAYNLQYARYFSFSLCYLLSS
jgi:hypothetical protein